MPATGAKSHCHHLLHLPRLFPTHSGCSPAGISPPLPGHHWIRLELHPHVDPLLQPLPLSLEPQNGSSVCPSSSRLSPYRATELARYTGCATRASHTPPPPHADFPSEPSNAFRIGARSFLDVGEASLVCSSFPTKHHSTYESPSL